MIRIRKPLKAPHVLTTKGAAQTQKNCADYNSGSRKFEFKSHIYNAKSVKNALLKTQHKKCCYCESKFLPTSYGAVEHFRPKGAVRQKQGQSQQYPGYYWLAYDWDNLLVSCEQCNSSHKGNLFPLAIQKRRARSHHDDITKEQPLFIDPAREDPRRHIRFRGQTVYGITKRGRETIQGMGLGREDLEEARIEKLELLRTLHLFVKLKKDSAEPNDQNIVEEARKLLAEAVLPNAEYSAMAQDFLNPANLSAANE